MTALSGRYAEIGLGPERARRMVHLAEAARAGMSISFHSDMPMAPAKPLQLIWSAVNRLTAEGPVSGPDQVIDLDTALRAVTIEAAYSIRQENDIGSITPGKLANFTVLEQSPYAVAPTALKDIPVWGTILEGRIQPAPAAPERRADASPTIRAVPASTRPDAPWPSGSAAAGKQRTLFRPEASSHLFCSHPGGEPTMSCACNGDAFASAVSRMLPRAVDESRTRPAD